MQEFYQVELEERFHATINGVDYTVVLANRAAFDGVSAGAHNDTPGMIVEGITDPLRALIVICDDVPDHRRPHVFAHEYLHAAFGEAGNQLYASIVLCKPEDAFASQENLCLFLGPILASAIGGPDDIFNKLRGPIGSRKKGKGASKTGPKKRGSSGTRR